MKQFDTIHNHLGVIKICHNFYKNTEADDMLLQLQEQIEWREGHIVLFGKNIKIPRLQAFYGEKGLEYTYSKKKLKAHPLPQLLQTMKNELMQHTNQRINCVLLNMYRDGKDSMGFHADDEPELGDSPNILSVSFGAERMLHFRQKDDYLNKFGVSLPHGSVLLMQAPLQSHWQHAILKSKTKEELRINLTWRHIVS